MDDYEHAEMMDYQYEERWKREELVGKLLDEIDALIPLIDHIYRPDFQHRLDAYRQQAEEMGI